MTLTPTNEDSWYMEETLRDKPLGLATFMDENINEGKQVMYGVR